MKSIVIIGSGFHSKVVVNEILKLKKYKILGFLDEKKKIGTVINKRHNLKIIGKLSKLKKLNNKNTFFFIAVGENFKRAKIYESLKKKTTGRIKWCKLISKDTIISKDVKIGVGTLIVNGSIINPDTKIGKHCIINTKSVIEHDNHFDDFTSTGPAVATGGNVKIKKFSHIGIGSIVKNNRTINKNTIVGGKSFVNKDCDELSVYYGLPAKKRRERKYDESYLK